MITNNKTAATVNGDLGEVINVLTNLVNTLESDKPQESNISELVKDLTGEVLDRGATKDSPISKSADFDLMSTEDKVEAILRDASSCNKMLSCNIEKDEDRSKYDMLLSHIKYGDESREDKLKLMKAFISLCISNGFELYEAVSRMIKSVDFSKFTLAELVDLFGIAAKTIKTSSAATANTAPQQKTAVNANTIINSINNTPVQDSPEEKAVKWLGQNVRFGNVTIPTDDAIGLFKIFNDPYIKTSLDSFKPIPQSDRIWYCLRNFDSYDKQQYKYAFAACSAIDPANARILFTVNPTTGLWHAELKRADEITKVS